MQVGDSESISGLIEQSPSTKESETINGSDKSSPNNENTSGVVPSGVVKGSAKSKMTVRELMDGYEVCISDLWRTQSRRRTNSLMRISPVNFTKEIFYCFCLGDSFSFERIEQLESEDRCRDYFAPTRRDPQDPFYGSSGASSFFPIL